MVRYKSNSNIEDLIKTQGDDEDKLISPRSEMNYIDNEFFK